LVEDHEKTIFLAEDHENIQVQVLKIVNTKNTDQVGPEQCISDVITAVAAVLYIMCGTW
jgi:uncharacterized protein with PQ loop repeat